MLGCLNRALRAAPGCILVVPTRGVMNRGVADWRRALLTTSTSPAAQPLTTVRGHENMDAKARRPGADHHRRYAGHQGMVGSNVHQRTVDYPEEWANGYNVLLDSEELVTVRADQVEEPG